MADESKSTGPKKVPYSAIDDESLVLHYVRVDVVKATGLRNADIVGKSDPFCEATVNQLVRTTPVVQDSLDPVWNSTFHYFVQDKPEVVDLKLWDEDDNLKNDLLGDAVLKLGPLWEAKTPEGATFSGELPVMYSGKQKGTITVKAYVRLMLPVKTEKKLESTTKELEKTVVVVEETKNKLAETSSVLGKTQTDLEEKAKALGMTTEELAAKRKEAEEKGQLLEYEKEEKKKVAEALEEKARALGITTEELAAKTKEAEEKAKALAKEQEEKQKIALELKQKYDKMMELQKQLEENKNDEDYLVIHLIHVSVVSAKGVRNADIGGKSDPYCEAIVQGLSRKTHVIDNNLDPVWNTNFAFFTQNMPAVIDFKLWDQDDHGKDDPLGDCKLELKEYFKSGEIFDGPLPIMYKGKQHGLLNIKLYCKVMHPVQTEKKLEETTTALTQTSEQKQKVEVELGKTSAELEAKYKELGDLTKGNKELKDKFDGLIEKLTIAEVGVKTKTEEVVKLERENGELRAKLTAETKLASDSKTTSDYITTENEKLKASEKENQKKIETLEKRISELEKDVKDAGEKLKEADSKVKEAETKAAKSPATTASTSTSTSTSTPTPATTTTTTTTTTTAKPSEEKVVPRESKARVSITGKAFGYSDKPADRAFLIKVHVLKGVSLRNAVLLGTIDPYCQLTAGDLSLARTKAIRSTLNPEWDSHANFLGEPGQKLPNTLQVSVYDEGQYFSSTLVGEGSVSLKELWEKGGSLETTVELSHKGRGAGKVQLKVTCTSVDS